MRVVAVSGGFDPLHFGHVKLFKEAKQLGDILVVILNNDNWLMKKKGFVFMKEQDRAEIIKELKCVDIVIFTNHKENPTDMSVCEELKILRPDIFANGGDRKKDNTPEDDVCRDLGILAVYGIGGEKIESSSELVAKAKVKQNDKI